MIFLNGNLRNVQAAAAKALTTFDALNPGKAIEPLADGLREIRKARNEVALKANRGQNPAHDDADFFACAKRARVFRSAANGGGRGRRCFE